MSLIDTEGLNKLNDLFLGLIKRNLKPEAFLWLETKVLLIKSEDKSTQLNLVFAQMPRFAAKELLVPNAAEAAEIDALLPGFALKGWTIERLCRVWILMQIPASNKTLYLEKIKSLFVAAEMNEQAALYSALPVLHYAEEWISKCEEGIRSNLGTVLEAVMYHNPYPAHFLSQGAWNQLILKAFFTEKEINKVVGLKERANELLSQALCDYAQERLAANRMVNPDLYKLINKNINS